MLHRYSLIRLIPMLFCLLLILSVAGSLTGCGKVEQTNRELTVYIDGGQYEMKQFERAKRDFTENHPDITVNFVGILEDMERQEVTDSYDQLKADLMAGKGPDLILFMRNFPMEMKKVMASGAFCDLTPYLEQDEDYLPEDFNQGVLTGGQLDGKQYIMPLHYSIPLIMTSEETIAETGFDLSKTSDYLSFATELNRYSKLPGARNIFPSPNYGKAALCSYSGLEATDFAQKKTLLDGENFRAAQELYREFYPFDSSIDYPPNENGYIMEAVHIDKDECILATPFEERDINNSCESGSGMGCITNAMAVYGKGEQPVFVPLRTVSGGIRALIQYSAAIRNNSENQQNAYDFLRILMGKNFQENFNVDWLPVRRAAVGSRYFTALDWSMATFTALNGEGYQLRPLFEDTLLEFIAITDEVECASFRINIESEVFSYMEPYYRGEKSYDACIKEATAKMQIYISE